MTDFRPGQPGSGHTYNGFAGPGAAGPPGRDEPRWVRELRRHRLVYAGIVAAIAAGLLFGAATRPNGLDEAAREREARGVPIELIAPAPVPPPVARGKLDVLPADTAPPIREAAASPPVLRPPPSRAVEDDGVLTEPPQARIEEDEAPLEPEDDEPPG